MEGLPQPMQKYAFAINERAWDGNDCASAGAHWNPTHEDHGETESGVGHVGDLLQLTSNLKGSVKYFEKASRPMLSGIYSVVGKSVSVYENSDDFGDSQTGSSLIDGNAGKILGCCIIKKMPNLDDIDEFLNN